MHLRRLSGATLLTLAAAVIANTGPAMANRLAFSHQFTAVSRGNVTVESEGTTLSECPLTLSGEMTYANVNIERPGEGGEAETLATVRSVTVGACAVNTFRVLGLPWRVQFREWLGGRPEVEPERVRGLLNQVFGLEFLISSLLRECLYRGIVGLLMGLEFAGGVFFETGVYTFLPAAQLALVRTLAGFCFPERIRVIGSFSASPTYGWVFSR